MKAIPTRLGTFFAAVLAASIVGAAPSAASAATGDPAVRSESERPARVLFQRAEAHFQAGRFGEALADYRAAYQIEPLPGFVFNMGQCYRNLRDYERARTAFRRYVALAPHSPNREVADKLITDMNRLLADQRAADQRPVAATTEPDPPDPAAKTATAVTTAAVPASATVSLPAPPAASTRPVSLTLAQHTAAASQASEPPPLVTVPRASDRDTSPPVYRRWWFWTGVGAVVVGGAVTALLLTRSNPEGTLHPITVGGGMAASGGPGMN
jgi:hypothetical protein